MTIAVDWDIKHQTKPKPTKKNIDNFVICWTGEESSASDASHWSEAPTPAPNVGFPQHQSTAVKRRRVHDEESNPSEIGSEQDFQDS